MDRPRPGRRIRSLAGGLMLTALLAGCGSVNTVSTRTAPAEDSLDDVTVQVNDVLSDIFLHSTDVRMFRTRGGPFEAQVDVVNDDIRQRRFAYRFNWLSPEGNVVPTQMSVWKTSSVPSGGSTTLRAIAPNDTASDFRLEIRRAD